MSASKIDQLNSTLRKQVGQVLLGYIPGQPIAISDVLVDQSLKSARVWVKAEAEIINKLNREHKEIEQLVKKHVRTRYIIYLQFVSDDNYLEEVDNLFAKLKHDPKA